MYWECRVPEMLWCVDLQLTVHFLGSRNIRIPVVLPSLGAQLPLCETVPTCMRYPCQSQYSTPPFLLYRDVTCLSEAHAPLGRAYC